MLNTTQVLDRLQISTASPSKAIQDVRERVMSAKDGLAEAIKIITNVTGRDTYESDDQHLALHIAQGVVQAALNDGDKFNPDTALKFAELAATKMRADPALAWLFGTAKKAATTTEEETAETTTPAPTGKKTKKVAGVSVAIKANGKIKKGGKQDAADALLLTVIDAKTHVSDKTNQDFVQMLVKELDMSKQGATTYAYNACKSYKATHGLGKTHEIFAKSKKGRKAAEE